MRHVTKPVFATLAPTLKCRTALEREAKIRRMWKLAEATAKTYQNIVDKWCCLYDLGLKKEARKLEPKLIFGRELAKQLIKNAEQLENQLSRKQRRIHRKKTESKKKLLERVLHSLAPIYKFPDIKVSLKHSRRVTIKV